MFALQGADFGQDAFGLIAPGASVFVQSCYNHGLKIRQEKSEGKDEAMPDFEMRVPALLAAERDVGSHGRGSSGERYRGSAADGRRRCGVD